MIVRKLDGGEMLLVPQTEHSRLVGQFGAHWGNDAFAVPTPYESVARAATFHDFGWLRYETAPQFDPANGETPFFRDVKTDENKLAEYRWCCEWFLAGDPYAAQIVSLHRTGLWKGRYGSIATPAPRERKLPALIESFIAEAETEQQHALAAHGWDPHELRTNYRLLQVWDLLGLYFGCQEPYDETIAPVPTSYRDADGEGATMTFTPAGPGRVRIEPYPFDARPFNVQMTAKRLPQTAYASEAAFRKAYFQAPLELMEFELV